MSDKVAHRILCSAALLPALCNTACGPSEGALWKAEEDAIQARYQEEYKQWSAKDTNAIIAQLVALQAPYFSPRPESRLQSIEVPARVVGDPTLLMLLDQPDTMVALDLQAPRRLPPGVDVHALIGRWRCEGEEDALHTVWLERNPVVPCSALENGLVIREGRATQDWLFMLPGRADCPWIHLLDFAQCFDSLKSWLAASVVGAQSRWAWFDRTETALVREMLSQPALELLGALEELRADQPLDPMGRPPDLSHVEFAPAGGDYPAVLRELGSHRPPVILSATQTYLAHEGYEAYGMVRLWTGRGFSNLRLRPEDLDHAVGIVTQYSHIPILVQLASNGRTLYVDIQSRRAFSSFKVWVDYGRAQERIWRRTGFALPHNHAHLPFG